MADFLQRRVRALRDVLQPVDFCPRLQLLPGASNTLDAANPHHASRLRLWRELARLDADVVLADLGAGASYATLDFFLAAEHRIAITTPDPTAIVDAYAFIKLAALRKVHARLGRKDDVSIELRRQDLPSLAHVLQFAGEADVERTRLIDEALRDYRPFLLINRVTPTSRVNVAQIKRILKQYVGSELDLLGEIPDDEAVQRSVRGYMPVLEYAPESAASAAWNEAADRLDAAIDAARRPAAPMGVALAG